MLYDICIIASPYSLASCLTRFSSLHTCSSFTSPRFYALPKVQHTPSKNAKLSCATTSFPWRRTKTWKNHGYNAVAHDSRAGSHLLSLATKKVRKVEKGKKNVGSTHALWSLPHQGEMFATFGSDWFRNVNLYKVQTNKQTHTNKQKIKKLSALYIRLWMRICVFAFVIRPENYIFSAPHYTRTVTCGFSGSTIFSTLPNKEQDFRKKN